MDKKMAIVTPGRGTFQPQYQTVSAPSVTSSAYQCNTFVLIQYGDPIKF